MGRPKESDRQDIRTLILDKAKDLFHREGYANITIRKIAREIHYTPATIYLYFKNKDEILYELHNEGFQRLYQSKMRMLADMKGGALERLAAGGRMYVEFALENPEYYEVMFNMPEPRHFMDQMRQEESGIGDDYALLSYRFLRQGVEMAQQEGYLPEHDTDAVAFSMWSLVHGMVSLIIRKRVPYPQPPDTPLAFSGVDFIMDLIESTLTAK
jgi:AcrR family transcriptional regulator